MLLISTTFYVVYIISKSHTYAFFFVSTEPAVATFDVHRVNHAPRILACKPYESDKYMKQV